MLELRPKPVFKSFNQLSLAWKFSLASLVVMVSSALILGWWVTNEIRNGVIHRVAANAALSVSSLLQPALQGLSSTEPVAPDRSAKLEGLLRATPLGARIVSFKLWGIGQRVLFSTTPSEQGHVFSDETQLEQVWNGQLYASFAPPHRPEVGFRNDPRFSVYTPLRAPGAAQVIAVAEFSMKTDDLERELLEAQSRSWLVVGAALLGAYLLLVGLVKRGSDTIANQRRTLETEAAKNEALREQVQRAASRATTLGERYLHRMSAELHDGPTQELTFALLKLDSLTQHHGEEASFAALEASLSKAMRETRAIATGLRLPDLEPLTLREVLERAVRDHQRRTESQVEVCITQLPEVVELPVKITAFRLVQEALTNAFRHGGGINQRVQLKSEAHHLILEVSDGGSGFVYQTQPAQREHLGLAGMRERVESLGGTFRVASAPGQGTSITARLPLTPGSEDA